MAIFRKFFYFLLVPMLLLIFLFTVFQRIEPRTKDLITQALPCRSPIKYSIGQIDSQFDITPEQFKELATEAAHQWETASGLKLFQYEANASLQIRMIYDKRQQAADEARELDKDLALLNSQKSKLEGQQNFLSSQYSQKLSDFQSAVKKYEKKVRNYNQEVSDWNESGGTSEAEYNKLKKTEENLKSEFKKLKEMESELNDLAKKSNNVVAQENKIIINYNEAVSTYKSKFGTAQEFEKGLFDPSAGITIYQFKEKSDLRMTLIHELGHALGIEHVENPQSIMYYMMGEQNLDNPSFTSEDISALKKVCRL